MNQEAEVAGSRMVGMSQNHATALQSGTEQDSVSKERERERGTGDSSTGRGSREAEAM